MCFRRCNLQLKSAVFCAPTEGDQVSGKENMVMQGLFGVTVIVEQCLRCRDWKETRLTGDHVEALWQKRGTAK